MAQGLSLWPTTAETQVRSRVSPCSIFGWTKWQWVRFSPQYCGFRLSISFDWCSTICKRTKNNIYHRVAQEALMLRCVRRVSCGALLH
jgi:hypothetical protein